MITYRALRFRPQTALFPLGSTLSTPLLAMSLSPEDVSRIALLSRIELSAAELETTRDQLNGILGFIEQLQAVDTTGIEPMAHAVDVVQRLRPDVVTETDRRAEFQAVAPETEAGLYLVPRVVE
jgi:aspartyl-tRNA(Asn)/glutamyl-tRNA(Gln) amidotransferase subunit C